MPTATVSDVCPNSSLVAKNSMPSHRVRYVGTRSMMGRIPLDGSSDRYYQQLQLTTSVPIWILGY